MAGKAAAALIQSRRTGAQDRQARRVRGQAGSSPAGSLNYAPYERTFRGLPVVGGDFVVVTDDEGHVLNTSVAQTSRIRLAVDHPARAQGPGHRRARRR